MKELNKVYDFQDVEQRIYAGWLEDKCFYVEPDPAKKPYTIIMPPPNITGQLHMGHALDAVLQDSLTRMKRMQGYAALWLPGTDHASIATEVRIIEAMSQEGLTKKDLGRERFLQRAWAWRDEYGGRIVEQQKRLGGSCDWSRSVFTMDEGVSKAVVEMFIRLYKKGLIYRGNRIINWCPDCNTALSDAEVEYEDHDSHLWHIRYSTKDGDASLVVATTRPETMLGDTGVAVNPNDERYRHLIGKTVILPLMDREIPVFGDEYVDMEFGTGAVKVTPAHDINDFEMGQRHDLQQIRIMDDHGVINENGGRFQGMDRFEARKAVVEALEQLACLVGIEDHAHSVGQCYRCGTVVEPITSEQWFVAMKPLAKPAIDRVKDGSIRFNSERFEKIYYNWMENVRDWCISRQLWWGHRIPAWYCDDCGHITVAAHTPDKCEECGSMNINQDEDVLDTWFSSGLWPFSTLGWPEKTEDLEYFYPTDTMVTAYDIIFFWVARMVVFGIEAMGEIPFKNVLIHGLVRDEQGRKMSKSLGNGIDPLEVLEQYGADALRFSLVQNNSIDSDSRFSYEKTESCRNFANKIWNASRFVMMNAAKVEGSFTPKGLSGIQLRDEDKWILAKLNDTIDGLTASMENYEMGIAAQKIYEFVWDDYCDWYIEMAKSRLNDKSARTGALEVLYHVLEQILKLLHPFMPFITEELYQALPHTQGHIMLSDWPQSNPDYAFAQEKENTEGIMEIIRAARNIRRELNIKQGKKATLYVVPTEGIVFGSKTGREAAMQGADYFARLAYASEVILAGANDIPEGCATAVCPMGSLFLPIGELIDIAQERSRLQKEMDRLQGEIKRAEGKLNNPGFTGKAPEKVVQDERDKLAEYKDMLQRTSHMLEQLPQ